MKIISFNVNGIRARIHQLKALIEKHSPDIIGLQETKVHDSEFPVDDITSLGYHVEYHGQKTHYGVAIMSKKKPVKVIKGFSTDDDKAQKRLIGGTYESDNGELVTVLNGYFPQGESATHEVKFPNKRVFYKNITELVQDLPEENVAVIGDMNVAYEDTDIGIGEDSKKRWLKTQKCSFLPEEREWFTTLLGAGLKDTYRMINPDKDDVFSWFDYRSKGFDREPKRGLRIDYVLASNPLADKLDECGIDYEIRGMEKPSDHCPVWSTFKI